jgi:hypothetical protein
LGQLRHFIDVFPHECMGRIFWANLTPFSPLRGME